MLIRLLLLVACLPIYSFAQISSSYNPDMLKRMKFRMAGPYLGGRVTAVEGIAEQPHTFFMGTTGGGVWKSDDAGNSWSNISDGFFQTGSIGSIEVANSDPQVIYVGTGSDCIRGNISIGKGIYRSQNGGLSWTHMGLEKVGQIGTVLTHPSNPDLVYAGALGNPFGKNKERGVFRSEDGGINWEQVLFHSDSVGVIDMTMRPDKPEVIFAALWRAERKPWTLIDGAETGGLYVSRDGGDKWKKVTNGLPTGMVGRMGISISPANPDKIWVMVEALPEEEGGLYRSDDGGLSFQRINRSHELRNRAWYYNHVHAHPLNENIVYINNVRLQRSVDGGKHFTSIKTPHGDCHDLWINPFNPDIMINGNDGGACVSLNGGKTWSSQLNQPTAEFYRLAVDNQFPYRLYSCQQDRSSISIPSKMEGGITAKNHWYGTGGGESGHIAVDPRDPHIVYAGNYVGEITHFNLRSGMDRNINSYPQLHDGHAPRDVKYRFQWNAPIRISPHDPDILYHCSQYVHRSKDQGHSWEVISHDLTTNNDRYQDIPGSPIQHDHTGVELYTTIFAFEESPHTPGELWAGSDDGLLHLSRDHGKNWINITPQDFPKEGTINSIELSKHAPGRAIISVYKYRENDFRPYVFLTNDHGNSWESLCNGENGIPHNYPVRVVREDPDRKGLLFAGTEFGLFISNDSGKNWQSFQQNVPITPITDIQVHRQDLVLATQGRSFWILDDLTPLHQLQDFSQIQLLKPRPAYRTNTRSPKGPHNPKSLEAGALIHIFFPELPLEKVKLNIYDSQGGLVLGMSSRPDKLLREKPLRIQPGLNRINWNLQGPSPEIEPRTYWSLGHKKGPYVPPGIYNLELQINDNVHNTQLEVKIDPRWKATTKDLVAQYEFSKDIVSRIEQIHDAIYQLRNTHSQLQKLLDQDQRTRKPQEILGRASTLSVKVRRLEDQLIQSKSESSQDPLNYTPKLDNQYAYLYGVVNEQHAAPTQGALQRFADLNKTWNALRQEFVRLYEQEVQPFWVEVEEIGLEQQAGTKAKK